MSDAEKFKMVLVVFTAIFLMVYIPTKILFYLFDKAKGRNDDK